MDPDVVVAAKGVSNPRFRRDI